MVPMQSAKRLAGRLFATTLAALMAAAPASAREPPRTEHELIDRVRTAIAERDLASLSELINWDGAATIKRRIVNFQVRHGLGRPVRSIVLEPFPQGGLREIEAGGRLKANMPVSHRLRIVFDEPGENGVRPASIFLVGKMGDGFMIALVVRAKRSDDD